MATEAEDSTGESTTAQHATSRHYKVLSLSSTWHIHRVFSGFNWEKVRVLESIGFGGLLKMPRVRELDQQFSLFLFQNLDCERSVLSIGNGYELPIRDIDVHLALGIPHRGSRVIHDGSNPFGCIPDEVRNCLFRGGTGGHLTMDYLEQILSMEHPGGMSKQAENAFKVAAVLFSVGHFLAPLSSKPKVPTWIIKTLINPNILSKFNWSAYVLWFLRRGAKLAQEQVARGCETISLHGCGLLLQVLYFDNMDFGCLNHVHSLRPHAADFTEEQLNQFIQAATLDQTRTRSSYALPKPRSIQTVCYSWAMRMKGAALNENEEEPYPTLSLPTDTLKEGINLLQDFRSNIATALQQQHNLLLDQFIDFISPAVQPQMPAAACPINDGATSPCDGDHEHPHVWTKRPARRQSETSFPTQPKGCTGNPLIHQFNDFISASVQAQTNDRVNNNHDAPGRQAACCSRTGTKRAASRNKKDDEVRGMVPFAAPTKMSRSGPSDLAIIDTHLPVDVVQQNTAINTGHDGSTMLTIRGSQLFDIVQGAPVPRNVVGIRIAAEIIQAVRRSMTDTTPHAATCDVILASPEIGALVTTNCQDPAAPHECNEGHEAGPSTELQNEERTTVNEEPPEGAHQHPVLLDISDSEEELSVQVVVSHSNFVPHPKEFGLGHGVPNPKHANQVYDAYEAGCAQTQRDHFVHYFPGKLVINGASLWSQLMRGGSFGLTVVDAIMRLYKSLDDNMYEDGHTRWRHFLPASFADKVLNGENYIDDRAIRASFVSRHIHYSVPDCSMLVLPVLMDGKWSCYFWDFAARKIHVLDPTMMRSTSAAVQRRHFLTVSRLNTALEICKDTFFTGWSAAMTSWPRQFHVYIGASCHRNNSGVVATHYARAFTGARLLWELKPEQQKATRAELLLQLLSMGCNCGDIPDVMTKILDDL